MPMQTNDTFLNEVFIQFSTLPLIPWLLQFSCFQLSEFQTLRFSSFRIVVQGILDIRELALSGFQHLGLWYLRSCLLRL
jgi:hypothetical protein